MELWHLLTAKNFLQITTLYAIKGWCFMKSKLSKNLKFIGGGIALSAGIYLGTFLLAFLFSSNDLAQICSLPLFWMITVYIMCWWCPMQKWSFMLSSLLSSILLYVICYLIFMSIWGQDSIFDPSFTYFIFLMGIAFIVLPFMAVISIINAIRNLYLSRSKKKNN